VFVGLESSHATDAQYVVAAVLFADLQRLRTSGALSARFPAFCLTREVDTRGERAYSLAVKRNRVHNIHRYPRVVSA
jgi:hypothetical protein